MAEITSDSTRRKNDRRINAVPVPFEDRRFLDRRRPEVEIEKEIIVPRYADNYSSLAIEKRLKWLEKQTNKNLDLFKSFIHDPRLLTKNIENCIGVTHVPIGVAGPLQINGKHANGMFYLPMATNQGTLIDAYHRGALVATMAGGVNVVCYKDGVHLSPSFVFRDLHESLKFATWVRENQEKIQRAVESTSHHAKIIRATPFLLGRIAVLNCLFKTGDASGLNMINIACDAVCKMIANELQPERYFLRSNFSSDKKPSYFNLIFGYGKEVMAELTLSRILIRRLMRTTPEDMFAFWYQAFIASVQVGMMGPNAHFANGLSALYIATGQDIAQVVNSSNGILTLEVLKSGDLRIYCKFPQMIVSTVGGGTVLPYPRAALEMLGCYGEGKVLKLAEIFAAAALAGEVSICGALAAGEFAAADLALRKREK
jgi:hydroxymethylglutaryl-CoA reductase (NADPH)